jgi:hypothetical protein
VTESGRTHETRDLRPRFILYFLLGLTLVGIACHGMVGQLFVRLRSREDRRDAALGPARLLPIRPQPHLEEESGEALRERRHWEEEELGRFGWIDRKRGLVRIPIDLAMDHLVHEGLPVRKTSSE